MKRIAIHGSSLLMGVALLIVPMLIGCTGRSSLIPNPDPALRKSAAQFASDAAKRFPYKADAPRGDIKDATARAQIHYAPVNQFDVVNLSSSQDFADVEIWIQKKYVIFLPKMERNLLKRLDFKAIYDQDGNPYVVDKNSPRVTSIEMLKDGKMYEIPVQIGD